MTIIDLCISWNKEKAKKAKTPEDKARYEENVKHLQEYKNA